MKPMFLPPAEDGKLVRTTLRLPPYGSTRELPGVGLVPTYADWIAQPGERLIHIGLPLFLRPCVARAARRLIGRPCRVGGQGTVMRNLLQLPDCPADRIFTVGEPLLTDGDLCARVTIVCRDSDGELTGSGLHLLIEDDETDLVRSARFLDTVLVKVLEALAEEADKIIEARTGLHVRGEPLPGLYLPDGMKEDILGDLDSFFGSYDLCRELRIPWRRGYLLYGEPGNGKSRLIRQIGEHFNLSLSDIGTRVDQHGQLHIGNEDAPYNPDPDESNKEDALHRTLLRSERMVVRNTVPDIIPATLMARLTALRKPQAFYLEDLDKFVAFQGGEKHKDAARIPLHELLKAIDGVEGATGTVIFMTTNYPEMVAESLVRRPGRIDRIWKLGLPAPAQMTRLLDGLGYCCKDKGAAEVSRELCADRASMAFAEELVRALRMRHRRLEFSRDEVDAELAVIREHLALTDPTRPRWDADKKRAGFGAEA